MPNKDKEENKLNMQDLEEVTGGVRHSKYSSKYRPKRKKSRVDPSANCHHTYAQSQYGPWKACTKCGNPG